LKQSGARFQALVEALERKTTMKKHHIKTMTALLAASTATWLTAAPASAVGPYVEPIGSAYQITPILSVADQVPETSDPSRQYQMVGIPDGLGAYAKPDGTIVLLLNHELTKEQCPSHLWTVR
jgi:hypothetical protein